MPEAGQGAVALQVRAGEEALVGAADDPRPAVVSRPSAPASRESAAGCLAPVAAHHDGRTLTALVAAEDGSWIERRRGADPVALADELIAATLPGQAEVGRTVVLTRARDGADELAGRLRAEGIEVVECPLIRIEPLDGPPIELSGYDWLVLTSARAVQCLEARLPSWEGLPSVAVIGPGTAEALRSRGVEPALVAGRSTQEGLMAELRPLLAAHGRPSRILFAGADGRTGPARA